MMTLYNRLILNSHTRGPLADTIVLNAISNKILKFDHSKFHWGFVWYYYLLRHYNLFHYTYITS